MIDANSQQGGKKGKDKSKDVMGPIKECLVEINTTMSALMGRVDNIDRHFEELIQGGHGRA